jgi:GNAT superfamily N-acetyltransferase
MPEIRRATPADLPAVARLYAEIFRDADWLPAAARADADFGRDSSDEQVFVCVHEGRLQGFISVYVPESFIHHLYVAPQHQRQGVGSALLDSLQPWLARPWRLKCVTANRRALAFYETRHWLPTDRGESEHGEYVLLTF